ncbi:MAG: transposase (plasmid) [Candidatus Entotheonella factor]|uniref:Mutator family transposase n=1 Tax=Entotheonella factor TaxID=1429438 RepID=W4M1Q4_ENTF1|nr:MAG: transposase [Candidatus Entotheonella factor]
MKIEVSVPEIVSIFKEIQTQPEQLFDLIRSDVRQCVGPYLSDMMEVELTQFLGREPYERTDKPCNHRNGCYGRKFTLKGIGQVDVKIPRDRQGEFQTQVIPRSKQYEDQLRQDLSLMFLTGINTRTLSMMSTRLIGRRVSPTEVSNANKELIQAVEQWRQRDLSQEHIKYLFIDGVNFDMRLGDSVEKVAVLAAIGVSETGARMVLGLQSGDKESASNWREFFKDLKGRGLQSHLVTRGIMAGLTGLEKVFKEEFSKAKIQRCQVHVSRNVLAKVPKKYKQDVADDMRSIFYASNKEKSLSFWESFKTRWEPVVPSAVSCLDNSIDSCLTFFTCPEEEWISLRTTNIIERLNKEFKRRTKSMEIVAGEQACYTLLAFISLKMELSWRSSPVGKVRKNLPRLQAENFTHIT